MLQWDVILSVRQLARFSPTLFAPLLLSQCGVADLPPIGTTTQPILDGVVVDAQDAPVLMLSSPEGKCTASLVAPNLALTARHCVASQISGGFACTAQGELVPTGTGVGSIGSDDPSSSLRFFTSQRATSALVKSEAPDALGIRTISTGTPSACRDDLAFVVLDRALAQLSPMPLRAAAPSVVGEMLSIWGYGYTENVHDSVALRVRADAVLIAVGPDTPSDETQPAPVRAIRTSPLTCAGDSGGPIVSVATGEIVAVVSVGSNAGTSGPICSNNELAQTVGPRVAAYPTLIAEAFAAAAALAAPLDGSVDASDPGSGLFADAADELGGDEAADAAVFGRGSAAADSADGPNLDEPLDVDGAEATEEPVGYLGGGGCTVNRRRSDATGSAKLTAILAAALAAARTLRRTAARPATRPGSSPS